MRTLVGGVGYYHLRDFSAGPALAARLQQEAWPADVVVEDLSYGPVIVSHRLGDERPPFARWVLFGAVRRGRVPGAVTAYRWDGALPDPDEIQARVAEAVGGVLGLDNLVVVTAGLGAAPAETVVVEIEPLVEDFGETLSPPVSVALEEAAALIRQIVSGRPLTVAPLGGSCAS
jgi:hydrogenase maturation protease